MADSRVPVSPGFSDFTTTETAPNPDDVSDLSSRSSQRARARASRRFPQTIAWHDHEAEEYRSIPASDHDHDHGHGEADSLQQHGEEDIQQRQGEPDILQRQGEAHGLRQDGEADSLQQRDEADVLQRRGEAGFPHLGRAAGNLSPNQLTYASVTTPLTAARDASTTQAVDVPWDAHRMWNSVWLHAWVLLLFAATFLAMLLVIVVLFHVSETNQGLSAEDATRHYGWTYGPTVVLTIVLSLWNQLDYSVKHLMPWAELRRGPETAPKTVLLDYITPVWALSLWRAAKARHWAVIASILGVLLIQLTTVFSTGLFSLEPTSMAKDGVPLITNNVFDGSNFRLNSTASNIKADPTIQYYGVRLQGLPYPAGVGPDFAVVDFEPANGTATPPGTNYTAVVPGAAVDFDCEYLPGLNGTKASLPWWSIMGSFFLTNITTPSCSLTNVIVAEGPDHGMYHDEAADQAYMGYMKDYICDPEIDYSGPPDSLPQPSNASAEHRIVMSVADLRLSPYNPMSNGPEYIYINNLTLAVCKPSYSLQDNKATYLNSLDGSEKKVQTAPVPDSSSSEIPGFPVRDLGAAVQRSLDKTYLGPGGDDWKLSKQVEPFFQILSAMNGNQTIGVFMDPQRLIDSGSEAFKGISSQLIHNYMMPSTKGDIQGQLLYTENRLWVRPLSFAFMVAFLAILALVSLALVFVRPWNVAPREPGPIAGSASILAASPGLIPVMSGLAMARTRRIKEKLANVRFQSRLAGDPKQPRFTIEASESTIEKGSAASIRASSTKTHWWRPSSTTWWFQALALLVPAAVIIALEVIQRKSDMYQGFVDVNPDGFANTHALATYGPAAIAFVITAMFASVRLFASILAPWMALKKGSAPASRSLYLNLTNRLPPHRLWLAVTSGNFGVFIICLANVVAAWLPAVVSGLYVVVPVPTPTMVTLQQADVFNYRANNLFYTDNNAGTTTGLIVYNNLSYPQWTYEDLAMNAFESVDFNLDSLQPGTQAPFLATVTAARPGLNCTVIPQNAMRAKNGLGGYAGTATMSLNATIPWPCDHANPFAETAYWAQQFSLPNDTTPVYFGRASVLAWGNETVQGSGYVDTRLDVSLATSWAPDTVANWVGGYGCPSFAVTVGRASATPRRRKLKAGGKKGEEEEDTEQLFDFDFDVATVMCRQRIQSVSTNVSLALPSMQITPGTMPVTDESTARYLVNHYSEHDFTSTTFEYPINAMLQTLTSATANRTVPLPSGDGDASPNLNDLDSFVTVLATANSTMQIEDLAGAAHADRVTAAANDLYRKYMAQAISSNFRTTDLSAKISTPEAAAATADIVPQRTQVQVPGRSRLQQQNGPKAALQAMLAVMMACLILGRLLMWDMQSVVPHNPTTIAGGISLLAEGEVAAPGRGLLPAGAEWASDAALRAAGVFEGWLFSLGWWESGGLYRYGVDIGWIQEAQAQQ